MHVQGLLRDHRRACTPASLFDLIEQMGFVQIDTINVIERAHHLTLFSRFHDFRPAALATLLEDRRLLFEHWTHDASVIPTSLYAHWRHRFIRYRQRTLANGWWSRRIGANPDAVIEHVLERIRSEGPLQSRDFEHDRTQHVPPEEGWWGWKPQKAAMEYLWRSGELAVARRINFQKVYDLAERVHPEAHQQPASLKEHHIEWACRSALERLGFATAAEIAAFWHAVDLTTVRQWCERAKSARQIEEVMVESADGSKPRPAYALRGWQERIKRLPEPESRGESMRLLSPFDPVLRDRKRTMRLFNFDYTFEAFTPGPKRKYGYYVLPILQHDNLIGRLDAKVHRDRGVLQIHGLWWENHIKPTRARMRAVQEAINNLAAFVGARDVQMPVQR